MKSSFVRTGLQVLVAVWAAYIVILYYIDAFQLIDNYRTSIPVIAWALWIYYISKVLWVLGFGVVGYGLGRAILNLLKISPDLDTIEDSIIYSLAVGWGLLGLGALLLGSLGLMDRWLHLGLAIAIVLFTHRQIFGLIKSWRDLGGKIRLSAVEWLITVCMGTVIIWGMGLSFLPEYGFDALNSHLPAPAQYIQDGRIGFHPQINFNNFPQTVEMWFMESMMWIPTAASAHLMMICHLLIALTVFTATRRYFGRGAGMAAALIYLLMKKSYMLATVSFIDQGLALMLVLGMYGLLRYLEKPSTGRALLVGIVFGFACGMKYSAFITVFLVALVGIGYTLYEKRKFTEFLKHFGLAAIVMLVICSPWYIRNYVWFHNPFFPFFGNLFPSGGGTYGEYAHHLAVDHREMLNMFALESKNLIYFAILPFTLAFEKFGPYEMKGGAIGIIPLLTLPLGLFIRNTSRIFWVIVILIVLTFAYWWFIEGMLMLRYMMPIFSMIAVLSGYFLWEGLRLETVKVKGIGGWVAMAIIFVIVVSYFTGVVTPPTVRGNMPLLSSDRDLFIRRLYPATPAIEDLNMRFEAEGILDDVKVYGFATEQYRWQADFTLIGSKVGYASYDEYLQHNRNPEELYYWLRSFDADYLVFDLMYATIVAQDLPEGDETKTIEEWATYYKLPSTMEGFEEYFEEVSFQYYLFVYRLR